MPSHLAVILSGAKNPPAKPVRAADNAANQNVRGVGEALRAEILRLFEPQNDERGERGENVKTAWVYIMANTHRTIYVGVTTNLERRVWDHKNRAFDGFTKRYGLTKLVYVAKYSRIDDAIVWEKSLKGKTRAKKLALIAEQNPRWNDLAWNWYDEAGNRKRPQ